MKPRYLSFLLLVTCLLYPLLAFAQWVPNGNVLSTALTDQWSLACVSDGAGGEIVVWSDYRNGTDYDIYAQRIDASGEVRWTVNGIPVCTVAGDQRFPTIASDGVGGAIVTWNDEGSYDIYAQRIDPSGAAQWPTNGVAVCTATGSQFNPRLISDGASGAILVWNDARNGDGDIYAQRIDASGAAQWPADGVGLCTGNGPQGYVTLVSDGTGGAIATWQDGRVHYYDLYAQRVSASGVSQWTANGVAVCTAIYDKGNLMIVSDDAAGAIIAWSDLRTFIDFDIFAQRVDASGTVQWAANGVGLCTATSYQYCSGMVPDGAGGAIVSWDDHRSGGHGVFAQRVDASGAPQWAANGIQCLLTGVGNDSRIASDGADGAIVTWHENNSSGNLDIYAQRVDGTGALQWGTAGAVLSAVTRNQEYPRIVSDGDAGAIVTWFDYRNGANADVYAQRVGPSGLIPTAVGSMTPSLPLIVGDNYPNPFFFGTNFDVTLGREANVKLEVFDAAGRRVRTMEMGRLPEGPSRLSFDGMDDRAHALASGVYFLRVHAAGESVTKKMVIVR